jgi:type I restriction enzyme R subunit
MPTPGEHKTVQARILASAEAICLRQAYGGQVGWTVVSREEAEERRAGFPTRLDGDNAGRNARAPLSLCFDDLLDAKMREPSRHLHTDLST